MPPSKAAVSLLVLAVSSWVCDSSNNCRYVAWKKATVCGRDDKTGALAGHTGAPPSNTSARTGATRDATPPHKSSAPRGVNSTFCRALGSPPPDYLAVVSRWKEDVSGTRKLPIPTVVYEHDLSQPGPLFYTVPVNQGSEASAYLQFIVDHYDCLPKWVLFLHGHGQTTTSTPLAPAGNSHHASDPSSHAALINTNLVGKGFLGLCHFTEDDYQKKNSMPKAAKAFAGSLKDTTALDYRACFQSEEKRRTCPCDMMAAILGSHDCPGSWAFNMGAEFWAKGSRARQRPLGFWERSLRISMTGASQPRFGHKDDGSSASRAGYCFETLWHVLFGERLHGYRPAFRALRELPLATPEDRCAAAHGSLGLPRQGGRPRAPQDETPPWTPLTNGPQVSLCALA